MTPSSTTPNNKVVVDNNKTRNSKWPSWMQPVGRGTERERREKGNNNVNVTTIIIDFTDWLYLLKK